MLEIQVDNWRKMDNVDLIVVDDYSKRNPANKVVGPEKGFYLYRVTDDIPWNNHGARNLAALMCETPWALFIDMDHLITPEDMKRLIQTHTDRENFAMFQRVTAPSMTYHKPHPNSFFVSRDKYWEVGGYNEDFCGSYGGDGVFIRQLSEKAGCVMRHDIRLIRYPREYVSDASTVDLDRDEYKKKYRKIFDKLRMSGDLSPKDPIRFKWERQF